ncbi:MAG: hypothetical protein JJU21_11565 [Salinarimonas sp.]|nr:hypothetical protein [Salinarimonas sp.]
MARPGRLAPEHVIRLQGRIVGKLAILVFIFTAPTLAGIFVIGVLTADMALASAMPIVLAALAGVLLAAPASWFIAKAILNSTRPRENENA